MIGIIVFHCSNTVNAWTCRSVARYPHSALTIPSPVRGIHADKHSKSRLWSEENDTVGSIERPDPSSLLAAQSDTQQKLGIVLIVTLLGLGTVVMVQLLTFLEAILPEGWFAAWRDYTWPIPLGLIFVAAGVTHFTMKDTYTAMVPPKGTWGGLWQVPAPYLDEVFQNKISYSEYHVYWSGIAEIGGGLLLLAAFGFHMVPMVLPAFLLLLLLICVTPANIYMATHDVQAPGLPPIPYPEGHIGRGVLQCILLALFWKLAFP